MDKETLDNERIGAGKPGPGRPKGSLNKTTRAAKDAIAEAAEALGGAERLTEWVKESPENEKVFWSSIYTKLIPVKTELSGPDGSPIPTTITVVGVTP